MQISPWTFAGTVGDEALSQITGTKDYVSWELLAGHLCYHMERSYLRIKPRISRARRLQETLREERSERRRKGEGEGERN